MIVDTRIRLPIEKHIETMFAAQSSDRTNNYPNVYGDLSEKVADGSLFQDVSEFVEYLDDNDVETACVANAEVVDEELSEYPDLFIGTASIDLSNGIAQEITHLEDQVKNKGYGMLEVSPFSSQTYSHDRQYYPFYTKCVEYDIPVWIHTSSNFTRFAESEYGHPKYLDTICCDFPELKVIAGHGGWPWTNHLVALLWKHPNLYTDFSAQRFKYIGQNTDWAPIREYGSSLLADKMLFATGYPDLDYETQRGDIERLGLDEDVQRKWLSENAATVLGL
jgi:predicted TIM-barrel fold metal-dependent hydrolase